MSEPRNTYHRRARRNLRTAQALFQLDAEEYADEICYNAQQATEKYLKGALLRRESEWLWYMTYGSSPLSWSDSMPHGSNSQQSAPDSRATTRFSTMTTVLMMYSRQKRSRWPNV